MIFRKVALERLSSPEQLDQLMRVTTPVGWLALGAIGCLLAATLAWGILGSLPTEAGGEGILLRRGGVSDLVARASGQIADVRVQVGDAIRSGQVVATVRQEALERELAETRAKRDTQQEELDKLLSFSDEQRRLQARNRRQQRSQLEQALATLESDRRLLEERIAAEEGLLADGLITQQKLVTTKQELNATRDRIANNRLDLDGLELSRLETEQSILKEIEAQRTEVRNLGYEIADLEARLRENLNIVAPRQGRVLELMVDPGDVVDGSTPILSLEVPEEDLVAVLFVPASEGKQVAPGMTVRVSPSTVKREEYGYMIGTVDWAAEFPSTRRGMLRLLANEDLVSRLLAEGPLIQIDVTLEGDTNTPTGYRWSSSRGPDLEISSGTLADGRVVVREDRPIHLIMPKVRQNLGL
ncbi:MAG: NHLP bacteriocin system secretion protein [Acidobacteriota bacterium]